MGQALKDNADLVERIGKQMPTFLPSFEHLFAYTPFILLCIAGLAIGLRNWDSVDCVRWRFCRHWTAGSYKVSNKLWASSVIDPFRCNYWFAVTGIVDGTRNLSLN